MKLRKGRNVLPGKLRHACVGVLMSRAELERAAELTRRAGAWLVLDNTYGVVR